MFIVSPVHVTGIVCVILASLLGIVYLILAGAPDRYCIVNAGAVIAGLLLLPLAAQARRCPRIFIILSALILLVTAAFGINVDGIARWLGYRGFLLQPSFILLPAMAVLFAQSRSLVSAIGMIIAFWGLNLQPDDAMVAVLFSGVYMLTILRPGRMTLLVCVVGLTTVAIAMISPENLAPAPFVEEILLTAPDLSVWAGMAVWGGSLLLLAPMAIAALRKQADTDTVIVFGTVWLAAIAAAVLGDYPTPVVGYGASPIIGYLIGLAMIDPNINSVTRPPSAPQPE